MQAELGVELLDLLVEGVDAAADAGGGVIEGRGGGTSFLDPKRRCDAR